MTDKMTKFFGLDNPAGQVALAKEREGMWVEIKKALATLDRDIDRLYGERCDEFEITCACCVAWRTRDDLQWLLEIETS